MDEKESRPEEKKTLRLDNNSLAITAKAVKI